MDPVGHNSKYERSQIRTVYLIQFLFTLKNASSVGWVRHPAFRVQSSVVSAEADEAPYIRCRNLQFHRYSHDDNINDDDEV